MVEYLQAFLKDMNENRVLFLSIHLKHQWEAEELVLDLSWLMLKDDELHEICTSAVNMIKLRSIDLNLSRNKFNQNNINSIVFMLKNCINVNKLALNLE